MFTIASASENGFDIIVLKDESNNSSVEIIPACGGILHAFKIIHQGSSLNIIDGYANKKEFEKEVESKGFKGCKLSPFVCRMRNASYEFGGKEYTVNKFNPGQHALHGLIYDAPFEILSQKTTEESAVLELIYAYRGTDNGYPFKYDCQVLYELKSGNELAITTIIKNHENNAIPVSDGWHPYFTFGGPINELQLQFNSDQTLEFDADLLPTGKKLPSDLFNTLTAIEDTFLDNSFVVNFDLAQPVLIVRDASKNMQLEIFTDKSYPILQIYTPDHRQSIAIENLSAAPDAFNNQIGLTVLPAGKDVSFKTQYKLSNI